MNEHLTKFSQRNLMVIENFLLYFFAPDESKDNSEYDRMMDSAKDYILEDHVDGEDSEEAIAERKGGKVTPRQALLGAALRELTNRMFNGKEKPITYRVFSTYDEPVIGDAKNYPEQWEVQVTQPDGETETVFYGDTQEEAIEMMNHIILAWYIQETAIINNPSIQEIAPVLAAIEKVRNDAELEIEFRRSFGTDWEFFIASLKQRGIAGVKPKAVKLLLTLANRE